jgi:hypothetical protein
MSGVVARLLRRLAPLAALAAAGCGGSSVFNDRVEGTVTLDETPLPSVMVQFVPEVGGGATAPSSSGVTDDQGRFKLTHDGQKPGAVVGKHRVVVVQGRGGRMGDDPDAPVLPPPPGPRVPAVYNLATQTPVEVEVTKTEHTYDVKLTQNAMPAPPR